MNTVQILTSLCLLVFYLLYLHLVNAQNSSSETTNVPSIYGSSAESHEVTTDDGYILQMFRIPQPQPLNLVVLFMHDIMCSSDDFVVGGPNGWMSEVASGFFDIWLGNARGNKYSMGHTTLNASTDRSYWNFSFHEIGVYDLPSMIDCILNVTSGPQTIFYYGVGQAAAAFYAMSSIRAEYLDKIYQHVAIAPIVFLGNVSSPYIKSISQIILQNQTLVELYSSMKFMPNEEFLDDFGRPECKDTTNNSAICDNIYFLITSYDSSYNYSDSEKSFILSHTPTTCSTKQLLHSAQLVVSGRFAQYDYGTEMNLEIYNSSTPPDYNLGEMSTFSQIIVASTNDLITSELDLQHLLSASNLPMNFIRSCNNVMHIDFWNVLAAQICLQ